MWTPAELSSEARRYRGRLWRVVEAQSRVSTMRLTKDLAEQAILEELIDEVKPPVPPECRHLHFLLATPFRYAPYPHGSRFRRAGQREGAFYASEAVETAIAELAFHRLLFFAEAPGAELPDRPIGHTAFSVECETGRMVDLTVPPLARDSAQWTHPSVYAACQALADVARAGAVAAIRYGSVRDPRKGCNLALLDPAAFVAAEPAEFQTWQIFVRPTGVQAVLEFPPAAVEFGESEFGDDPRCRGFFLR
jgi:hypothetical protein